MRLDTWIKTAAVVALILIAGFSGSACESRASEADFAKAKEEARAKLQEYQQRLAEAIAALEAQARTASADAKVKLDEAIRVASAKKDEAAQKLGELSSMTAEKWGEFQESLAQSWEDMKHYAAEKAHEAGDALDPATGKPGEPTEPGR